MLTSPPHPRIRCAYLQFYCINKNDSVAVGTIEKPRYYGNRRVIRFHWYKRLVFTSNRTDAPDRKLIFSALKRVLPRALEMPERRLKTQRIRGDNERYRFTDSLESYVFEGRGRGGGARGNEKRGHDLSLVRIRFENATAGQHRQPRACIIRNFRNVLNGSNFPATPFVLIAPFSLDSRWKSWWRNNILSKGGTKNFDEKLINLVKHCLLSSLGTMRHILSENSWLWKFLIIKTKWCWCFILFDNRCYDVLCASSNY